jgi:hypothetical protein
MFPVDSIQAVQNFLGGVRWKLELWTYIFQWDNLNREMPCHSRHSEPLCILNNFISPAFLMLRT